MFVLPYRCQDFPPNRTQDSVSRPPALLSQLSVAFNSEMCPRHFWNDLPGFQFNPFCNRTSQPPCSRLTASINIFTKRLPRPFSELTLSTTIGSGIFAGSNPFPSSRITIDSPLPGRCRCCQEKVGLCFGRND